MTTYRYRLTGALVALAMIGANGTVTEGQPAGPSALLSAVQSAQPEDDDFGAVAAAALDATPDDRARLAVILRRGSEAQRTAALFALAYSGGDDAIATLESYRDPTDDAGRRALLCFALARRGTAADRTALVRALRGEHIGDDWPPIVVAALSLGVLRATDSTPALARVAGTDVGSTAANAANEALRWIRQGPWRVELPTDASDDDAVIAAAFRNGIPRTADAPAFYETTRGGAWTLEGSAWRFRRGSRTAGMPALDFRVHRNAGGTRALLSVDVSFGLKNGSGYDYLLVRDGDNWCVTGVMFTWVS